MRIVLALLLLWPLAVPPARALDLQALVREVETQYWGTSSHAFVTLTVKTAHWQRTLEMESWSLGRERFLTRILEPAKERGVATLKVESEVWNYLPAVDRTLKIPPSMMGGAWMGSHITNDDLVKGSRIDADYTFALLEETPEIWRIDARPRPEAAVVWGRLTYTIDRASRTPREVAYYDEDDRRVRRLVFDELTPVAGRRLPLRLRVIPEDKPGESTVMVYRDLRFDLPLPADFFSLRSLRSR